MIEFSRFVVEPEQQRSDLAAPVSIPKPADDAVGCAKTLHLDHRALAGLVRAVKTLRHDAHRLNVDPRPANPPPRLDPG